MLSNVLWSSLAGASEGSDDMILYSISLTAHYVGNAAPELRDTMLHCILLNRCNDTCTYNYR